MVDAEVADKERAARPGERGRAELPAPGSDGAAEPSPGAVGETATLTAEVLADLAVRLVKLKRASIQLPPLTSKRRGLAARLELWFKRRIKRATHWYTWEQLNFNEAVGAALEDVLRALDAHERALLAAHKEARPSSIAAESERDSAPHAGEHAASPEPALVIAQRADAEARDASAAAHELRADIARLQDALRTNAAELRGEFNARAEELLDAQRVMFKQLALELGETATNVERAERGTRARLDTLAADVAELRDLGAQTERPARTDSGPPDSELIRRVAGASGESA